MLTHNDIQALIPHSGNMCLLASVTQWDSTHISCTAHSHRNPNNPLAQDGKLPILCGIEFAAQAMAAHGGLTRRVGQRPRAGLLVSVRDVVTRVKYLSDYEEALQIEAEQIMAGESGVTYTFALHIGDAELLSGRATVVLDAAVLDAASVRS